MRRYAASWTKRGDSRVTHLLDDRTDVSGRRYFLRCMHHDLTFTSFDIGDADVRINCDAKYALHEKMIIVNGYELLECTQQQI